MENAICQERHKNIDEKLEEHDLILKEHEKKIEDLSVDGREYKIQIQNLCCKIDNLISTFKWFMGIIATGIVGFIFYLIQLHIK